MNIFETAKIQLGHATWSATYRHYLGMPDYSTNPDGTKIDFSKGIGGGNNANQEVKNNVIPKNASTASFDNNADIITTSHNGSENDLYGNMNYRYMNDDRKEDNGVIDEQTVVCEGTEIQSNDIITPETIASAKVADTGIEASSTATYIPRVEDTTPKGDRQVDFSMFYENSQVKQGKGVEFGTNMKAAKSLRLAEKDLPPEERSVQGKIIDAIGYGARHMPFPDGSTVYQQDQQFYHEFDPSCYMNPYLEYNQYQNQPQPQEQQPQQQLPVDYGRFKVDYPKQEPPKVVKAEAEPVEGVEQIAEMVKGGTEALGVEPKDVKVKPSFIVTTPPKPSNDTVVEKVPDYDNKQMIQNHWWLEGVESAATRNKCAVQFIETVSADNNPIGIVRVNTYTKDASVDSFVFNRHKSFIIDYGKNFYDKRVKIFLTIDPNEVVDYTLQGYSFIESNNANGKGNDKRLNDGFLNILFSAGSLGVDPDKGLYTEGYRILNKFVNIATMPTNKSDGKDDRVLLRDRLFASVKVGVFDEARLYDPYSRFEFYDFDTNSKCFLLLNNSISQKLVAILYTPNDATVKTCTSYDEVIAEYKDICSKNKNHNKNNNDNRNNNKG